MDKAFYTGTAGISAHQARINVISNNIANANNCGFKKNTPRFSDLMYTNINAAAAETNLKAGSGAYLKRTDTDFSEGSIKITGSDYNFAVIGDGFFGLMDPETREVSYTRDGSFSLSYNGEDFRIVSGNKKWLLGSDGQPVTLENARGIKDLVASEDSLFEETVRIGIYTFDRKNGMLRIGSNEFAPAEKNGQPTVAKADAGNAMQGALESSNVEISVEFSQLIEAQRAYQFSLRMISAEDEVQGIINTLR